MRYNLIVIGGGAAGFYGAIRVAESRPDFSILVLEKSNKVLAKVKVSGGGRCNVTHHCFEEKELSEHYPRGEKLLRNLFRKHQPQHVVDWFKRNGVELKAEEDGRMFPTTDRSQTIIDCFLEKIRQYKIKLELGEGIKTIEPHGNGFKLISNAKEFFTDKVLVATGGHPSLASYNWLSSLGHSIIPPIPSLFTFNDSTKHFKDLMGLSVPNGYAKIIGTKFYEEGPVLITHWGLSGPAIIRLSAWAAEYLHDKNYEFEVLISWVGNISEEDLRTKLLKYKSEIGKRKIMGSPQFNLPQRLWVRLCELAEIDSEKIWGEISNRNLNKLLEGLLRTLFKIKGKTTFKEEFVTCGGVDLNQIDMETMQSKLIPNLFFAGEVLNIDGETGGFNFQAAWTTAFVAAQHISK